MSAVRRALVRLPHAERLAMRECLLRGAARNYAEACGATDEEASAAELREAAVGYAVTLLQGAAAGTTTRPAAKRPRPPSASKPPAP